MIGRNKDDLLEVGQAAESLGIVLNDRQIGYKKSNATKVMGNGVVKETVEISGRKVSYRKSVEATEIKSEPLEDNDVDVSPVGQKDRSKKDKKHRGSEVFEAEKVDDKTCNKCGKVFPSAGKLKLHMNVHKDEKERPFKCDVCEKGFSAPTSLKNHKLLHTGETLKCEFCSYTAVQKGNLKSHRLKVHKDLLENSDVKNVEIRDFLDKGVMNIDDQNEVVENEEKEDFHTQEDVSEVLNVDVSGDVPDENVVIRVENELSENGDTDLNDGSEEEKIVGVE